MKRKRSKGTRGGIDDRLERSSFADNDILIMERFLLRSFGATTILRYEGRKLRSESPTLKSSQFRRYSLGLRQTDIPGVGRRPCSKYHVRSSTWRWIERGRGVKYYGGKNLVTDQKWSYFVVRK